MTASICRYLGLLLRTPPMSASLRPDASLPDIALPIVQIGHFVFVLCRLVDLLASYPCNSKITLGSRVDAPSGSKLFGKRRRLSTMTLTLADLQCLYLRDPI